MVQLFQTKKKSAFAHSNRSGLPGDQSTILKILSSMQLLFDGDMTDLSHYDTRNFKSPNLGLPDDGYHWLPVYGFGFQIYFQV